MAERLIINEENPFWVGEWYVDPPSGRISHKGAEVKLEPKVMSVLVLLAQHPGEVVSRETLEDTIWPNVVVGYDALSGTIIKLRKALGDDSRNPQYLETISKKGYRLLAPVSNQQAGQAHKEVVQLKTEKLLPGLRFGPGILMTVVFFVISALGVLAYYLSSETAGIQQASTTEKASLLVLPFTNSNNVKEQEYFSDGITDDLINDLSRFSGLSVMARRTAYSFKNRTTNIQAIARNLGVTYVVDGDVRRDGNRLRINVQLIDANSGLNIWAQRFDRQTHDIFDVQDDIRKNILNSLSIKLTTEERNRESLRYTSNFEAYDVFLQGQAILVSRTSAAEHKVAQDLMRRATRLDPNFARAHAALAYTLADAFRQAWITDADQMRQEALAAGKRAIELDPNLPQTYWIMGNVYLFMFQDHDKAIEMAERCVKLAPDNNDGLLTLAVTYDYSGEPAKGKLIAEQIMANNKSYSSLVPAVLGLAEYQLAKYPEALAAYNKSLEINPTYVSALAHKVLIYYHMGEEGEATFQVDELYNLHPNFDMHAWVNALVFKDKSINKKYIEDMIKAGIRE